VAWAIIDTSVYVDHWERGLHADALAELRRAYIIRASAVVLSELRRGARTRKAQKLVAALRQLTPSWTPMAEDWWRAGELVGRLGQRRTWDRTRYHAFQNDALIALTARRFGAAVATTNREDFELLAREVGLRVLVL